MSWPRSFAISGRSIDRARPARRSEFKPRALRQIQTGADTGRVGRQIVLHNPDALGMRIVDIDEFTHALGVVFGGAPLGDLDVAPGPVDVDADEEIDGAVAAVLVIVALELTRLGRDGLAHLA